MPRVLVCNVWWVPPVRDPGACPEVLDEQERARYAAFRLPADRSRFVTGRLLARRALAAELRVEPSEIRLVARCRTCGGPHGKPVLHGSATPVDFSIAHAGDRVVVATVSGGRVGVDVERIDPLGPPGGLDEAEAGVLTSGERSALHACAPQDRAAGFFRLWTRKEAVLKATEQGLELPMSSFEVTGPASPPAVVTWRGAEGPGAEGPGAEGPGAVRMQDLDVGQGYAACVAVLTSRPLRVTEHPLGDLAAV